MIVFWILVMILTAVVILLLTHFCGKKVYEITEKIYKSFIEEDASEEERE